MYSCTNLDDISIFTCESKNIDTLIYCVYGLWLDLSSWFSRIHVTSPACCLGSPGSTVENKSRRWTSQPFDECRGGEPSRDGRTNMAWLSIILYRIIAQHVFIVTCSAGFGWFSDLLLLLLILTSVILIIVAQEWAIHDCKSVNGVTVNGEAVSEDGRSAASICPCEQMVRCYGHSFDRGIVHQNGAVRCLSCYLSFRNRRNCSEPCTVFVLWT